MDNPFSGRLRWSKLSAACKGRLLEGAAALSLYLRSRDIEVELLGELKAKRMDEILDGFVTAMHSYPSD